MMDIIYFLLCFIQPIALPIPEATTIIIGLATIGPHKTFILGVVGLVSGMIVMYKLCTTFSLKFINDQKEGIKKYRKYINNNPILATGLLFTVPILPDEVIIIGAAIAKIPFNILVPIVIVSKIISVGMIAYSEVISSYFNINNYVFIGIELIVLFIIAFIYKKLKEKK